MAMRVAGKVGDAGQVWGLSAQGQLVLGSHLRADLISHTAELDNASYLVRVSPNPQGQPHFDLGSGVSGQTPISRQIIQFAGFFIWGDRGFISIEPSARLGDNNPIRQF